MRIFKGNERGLPTADVYVEIDGGAVPLCVLQGKMTAFARFLQEWRERNEKVIETSFRRAI